MTKGRYANSSRLPMIGRDAYAGAARAHSAQGAAFDGRSEIQELQVVGDWAFMWSQLTVVPD
jgi:hypothetical protein